MNNTGGYRPEETQGELTTAPTKGGGTGAQKPSTMKGLIKQMEPQIRNALPKQIGVERFVRTALTALSTNPKLGACDQKSFLGSLMQAAQLGLEPNTPMGQAYLIPYGNQVQFQIGYKGILDLCYRSRQFKTIYAMEVFQEDQFNCRYGTDPHIEHVPADNPKGDAVKYYAVYVTVDGGVAFRVWSREKIEAHAKKTSQAYRSGKDSPWKDWFDEMAKKTVLRDLLKYAPKSAEVSQAVAHDGAVIRADVTDDQMVFTTEFEEVE